MLAMTRVTTYFRAGFALFLILFLACTPLANAATVPVLSVSAEPEIIITEVQTAADTASQEFIELYNTTDEDVDLSDSTKDAKVVWKLQLFSAASTSTGKPDWTKPSVTVALTGIIPARGYYLMASTGYAPGSIESDQSYSARLSDTGGGMQVVAVTSAATVAHDRMMWQETVDGITMPAGVVPTPPKKASVQRTLNGEDSYFNDDMSLMDFTVAADITPKDAWQPVVDEEGPVDESAVPPLENEDEQGESQPEIVADANSGLEAPYITEILPNPAPPLTDDADEFIELYNPNDAVFQLKDYVLETGISTIHEYVFADEAVLQPQSYTAFYARDTGLTLTNTTSKARFLDGEGTVLSESTAYSNTVEGSAWGLHGGIWQWTTTPTPGAINVLAVPIAAAAAGGNKAAVKPASKAVKKTTAKKAVAKVKGASVKKAITKKKKAAKPAVAAVAQTKAEPPQSPIHSGILVAVVAIALLYAAYEYRTDVSNHLYKLRHNRAIRFLARR